MTDPRRSGAHTRAGSDVLMPPMSDLKGMDVRDRDGDKIGRVDNIYTDTHDAAGTIRYLSISTGWFGKKRHIVPLDDVEWSGNELILPYGRDQLQSAPTYEDQDELSHDDEDRIYSHYGRPGYWEAVRAKQTTPAPTPEVAEAAVAEAMARGEDPLRRDVDTEAGRRDDLSDRRYEDDPNEGVFGARGTIRRYDW